MSESGREALADVEEWSGGPPRCLGVIGRLSRVVGIPPDVREWSGGPPGCSGAVGSPSRMSGSDRVAIPDVREWSRGPSGCRE